MRFLNMLAMLFCIMVYGQNDTLLYTGINDLRYYEKFMLETGLRIPVGNLAKKMDVSPEVGLWYRTILRSDDILDIGGTIGLPTGEKSFAYSGRGQEYRVDTAGITGMAGIRFSKVYDLGPGSWYTSSIEWVSSFGYAYFMYRDNLIVNDKVEDDSIKVLSTFHLGQGIRINVGDLGLQVQYACTPYGQFSKHVKNDFGAHSFDVGVVYRF